MSIKNNLQQAQRRESTKEVQSSQVPTCSKKSKYKGSPGKASPASACSKKSKYRGSTAASDKVNQPWPWQVTPGSNTQQVTKTKKSCNV